jgi:hypothetical protein
MMKLTKKPLHVLISPATLELLNKFHNTSGLNYSEIVENSLIYYINESIGLEGDRP